MHAHLVVKMWTKIEDRLKRTPLVSLPVKIADGREPPLVVREGEQHDLLGTAQTFAQAFRVPAAFVQSLAEAIFQRLGQQVAEVYVFTPSCSLDLSHN